MVKVIDLYQNIKNTLKENGIEGYQFETNCLMEHVFNKKLPMILMDKYDIVSQDKSNQLEQMLSQRCLGYPLQYILGEWEFYGYNFKVGDGVLIPRADTETLIDFIKEKYDVSDKLKIADLCSGSGCIAITLKKEFPNADVSAVELSAKALDYLKYNISLNEVDINIINSDVLESETALNFSDLDIIVSNPPYLTQNDMENLQKEVQSEPEMALYGGAEGLVFYENIPRVWKNSLKNDGRIIFEIGINQEYSVSKILEENGFSNIEYKKDCSGIIRVISAIYKKEL